MGKQRKRVKKKSKYNRICEICGNETFSVKKEFKCKFCEMLNKGNEGE